MKREKKKEKEKKTKKKKTGDCQSMATRFTSFIFL